MRQVAHQAETYPGFCSMKRLAWVIPSIKFAGTHLYTWVMRGTVSKVVHKCQTYHKTKSGKQQ